MKLQELYEVIEDPRIQKGLNAQDVVVQHLQDEFADAFELVSVAGRNKKSPDIVANIHGHKTVFEVKLRSKPTDPVTLYEASLARGGRDRMLDSFARAETNGQAKTFTDLIDIQRETDPSRGWPGDSPEVPKTGGIFVSSQNPKTISVVRKYLLRHLKENHDDYFVIATASTDAVDIYDIGSTNHEIPAPRLPNIRRVIVKTYGSGHQSSKTGQYNARITIKAVFAK